MRRTPENSASAKTARLSLCPVSFADAADFVRLHHRHHEPPVGHKFSVGVALGDTLVGVAMVSRPVARHFDDGRTLEVVRSATDATANANSMLYGAVWRAAKALGYTRLITYTQCGESGSSLRAAGYRVVAQRKSRKAWNCPSRPRIDRSTGQVARTLWEAR
ncbi:XF1762 family protein [Nocardia sp. JCM 34519.1]|uniref:XF1762 family protein n=1 Tax=unclassified Nocardia TaxID=2637762 RepID=UPI0035A9A0F4